MKGALVLLWWEYVIYCYKENNDDMVANVSSIAVFITLRPSGPLPCSSVNCTIEMF